MKGKRKKIINKAWGAINEDGFIAYQHLKPTRAMAIEEFTGCTGKMIEGYKIVRVLITEI